MDQVGVSDEELISIIWRILHNTRCPSNACPLYTATFGTAAGGTGVFPMRKSKSSTNRTLPAGNMVNRHGCGTFFTGSRKCNSEQEKEVLDRMVSIREEFNRDCPSLRQPSSTLMIPAAKSAAGCMIISTAA